MHSRVLESSFLLVLQQVFQRLVGVVSTVILARILTPEDFGIVAIAMLVLWFADAITSTGTNLYIVQKETVSDSEINSSWTLDLILKFSIYIMLVGFSWLYGLSEGKFEISFVICAVGLLIVLGALKNPGLLILKRQQNYRKMVVEAVSTKVLAVCISIPAAFIFKNHWALVLALVISNLFSTIISYLISSYRPSFDFKHISVQWNFSKWLIPQALIGFLRSHIDTALVSAYFPASNLGGYNTTKYFAFMPVIVLINPLTAPLHAELGKVQSIKSELKKQYDLTSRILGFIIAPMISVIFVFSQEITALVLGDQWINYSDLLGYFAFTSASMAMLQQSTRLAMVNKKTKLIFYYEAISSSIILGCLIVSPKDSIFLLAIIKVVLELFLTILFYQYVYTFNFKVFALKNFSVLFLPTLVSLGVIHWFSTLPIQEIPMFVQLIFAGVISSFLVLLMVFTYLIFFATKHEINFSKKIYNLLLQKIVLRHSIK